MAINRLISICGYGYYEVSNSLRNYTKKSHDTGEEVAYFEVNN